MTTTMTRALTLGGLLALGLFGFSATSLTGCQGDSGGSTTGTAGTTGAGGTGSGQGTAGTGSGQGTAGTGSGQGTAGTGSGQGTAGTGSTQGAAGTGSAQGTAGTGGGAAGTTGTAGTGAGTAGTGGGAAGTGGGRPSGPSEGCNADVPNEAIGQAVSHNIVVTGMDPKYDAAYKNRTYCTTIPQDYDPTKPYPVVVYGGGCGAFGCEGSSFTGRKDIFLVQANISRATKDLVPTQAAPGCFQMGVVTTPDSPEATYFDQVMAEVSKKYCIDKGRVFVAGTSSGAWLSNTLACQRGNVIRGTAADSGGLGFDHGTCKAGTAVTFFPGDAGVKKDFMGREIGAAAARDMFIELNGCSKTPTQMKFGNDTCDVYGGCNSPVAWCNVGGGHQSGNSHLAPTGMAFWNSLK
jgi:poly(3-hydroxybutyrate) depolymerase